MKFIYFLTLLLVCVGCSNDSTPKPNAYLNLSYPRAVYKATSLDNKFRFEMSNQALMETEAKKYVNIHYPKLNADINITYQQVNGDVLRLIADAEKLTYKHTLKAQHIKVLPFENLERQTYARIFEISGDAASPVQFQVTDSVNHFINGSLYFDISPNYDSILPAIEFVKKDIKHLIETIEWQ